MKLCVKKVTLLSLLNLFHLYVITSESKESKLSKKGRFNEIDKAIVKEPSITVQNSISVALCCYNDVKKVLSCVENKINNIRMRGNFPRYVYSPYLLTYLDIKYELDYYQGLQRYLEKLIKYETTELNCLIKSMESCYDNIVTENPIRAADLMIDINLFKAQLSNGKEITTLKSFWEICALNIAQLEEYLKEFEKRHNITKYKEAEENEKSLLYQILNKAN